MQRFLDFVDEDMEAIIGATGRGDHPERIFQRNSLPVHPHRFGFTMEQAYVFGDSSNDLAMFEFADHAVAMGCHDPVLDPHAEYVTAEVEQDGIARALEHYGLI